MVRNSKIYMIMVLLIVSLALFGAGCTDSNDSGAGEDSVEGETAPAERAEIIVKGSDTVLPLSQSAAEEFMIANPDKDITVIGGGSGVGIAAMIDGEVEIAMASRSMKDSEFENAQANGINPIEHVIAWDGISVIVHNDNPVSELTFNQLRGIFNGTITNWNEVGGKDLEIVATTRDSSSGTYEFFKDAVLIDDEYREDALVTPSNGAIVQSVSQNEGGIGYIGFAYLDDSVQGVALDNGDGMVAPEPANILSGDYPLARQLYYYTDGQPSGLAAEFLSYIQSEEGAVIINDVGYFPAN